VSTHHAKTGGQNYSPDLAKQRQMMNLCRSRQSLKSTGWTMRYGAVALNLNTQKNGGC